MKVQYVIGGKEEGERKRLARRRSGREGRKGGKSEEGKEERREGN